MSSSLSLYLYVQAVTMFSTAPGCMSIQLPCPILSLCIIMYTQSPLSGSTLRFRNSLSLYVCVCVCVCLSLSLSLSLSLFQYDVYLCSHVYLYTERETLFDFCIFLLYPLPHPHVVLFRALRAFKDRSCQENHGHNNDIHHGRAYLEARKEKKFFK